MRYDTGDLWSYPADYRVVTTNGIIKKDGEAVMGAGVGLLAPLGAVHRCLEDSNRSGEVSR